MTKRKTFHDADLAAEKEQELKRAEKRKKMQAKLLAKVLTGPASVVAPMDEERVTSKKPLRANVPGGPARSKKPLRAKGPLQGVKKKKSKESKIHKRQLIRATKGRVRAAKPCPAVACGRHCQALGAPSALPLSSLLLSRASPGRKWRCEHGGRTPSSARGRCSAERAREIERAREREREVCARELRGAVCASGVRVRCRCVPVAGLWQ